MIYLSVFLVAASVATFATAAEVDFNIGGLKWRCQHGCGTIKGAKFVSVEQKEDIVTFVDANGGTVTGKAETVISKPTASAGPSLRCQMNPSYCGKEPKPKTSYRRSITIAEWNCAISVQEKDGEPNTPPPFKAKWLRFASPGCAMGTSIWTTLSARQVKALEKKCGEWGENC